MQSFGDAVNRMSYDMGGKLSHYYQSLQSRYGDPRVYAMQEEEMRARSAVAAHARASSAAEALQSAYYSQQETISKAHQLRMERLQGKNLVSSAAPAQTPAHSEPSQLPPPQDA